MLLFCEVVFELFERVEDCALDIYTACLHVLHNIFVFIVACTVSFECFDDAQVFANCCDVVFELFERVEDCAVHFISLVVMYGMTSSSW